MTLCFPEPLRAAITQRSLLVLPSRLITSVVESLVASAWFEDGLTSAGASGLRALISWIKLLSTVFQNVQLQP